MQEADRRRSLTIPDRSRIMTLQQKGKGKKMLSDLGYRHIHASQFKMRRVIQPCELE
jgi:hypothetical protein